MTGTAMTGTGMTGTGMTGTGMTGTGVLARFLLRRDRLRMAVWCVATTTLALFIARSFATLYPSAADRREFAESIAGNGAFAALTGVGYDLTSVGGLTAWRFGATGAVLTALMSAFLVIRNTRAPEDDGRAELVGSTAVGRGATLGSVLLVVTALNLLIATLIAAGLTAQGMPAGGAALFGLSLAGSGLVFAALAAVAAQIASGARAAAGVTVTAVGAAYLLRAVADSGGAGIGRLTWLSPIGWSQQTRAFAEDRWEVLLLPLATTVVLTAIAAALATRRDLGAGLVPERPGPSCAAPAFDGASSLAWRLQRTTLWGWVAGLAVFGGVLGAVAQGMLSLLDDNERLRDVVTALGGEGGIVDSYLAGMTALAGALAAFYCVQALLRMRAEETAQRAEPVLATAVGRVRWAAGHIVTAMLGPVLLLAAFGLCMGLAHGARAGGIGHESARLVLAALAQLPAVWVTGALVLALLGTAPRASTAGWALATAFLLLGQFGPTLDLPAWAMDLSPFTHVPRLPGGTAHVTPLVVSLALAAALVAAGLAGLRRRDIR